jgi:HlyD family secretion protein
MNFKALGAALSLPLLALLCGCPKAGGPAQSLWQGYVEGEYVYVAPVFGGKLESLKVRRGALVGSGEPLFKLDSQEEAAQLASAEGLLAQAQATLDDLRKGKRPEEISALEEVARQAKAGKDLAAIEFNRQTALLKGNATPVKDYDSANYALLQYSARFAETNANLLIAKLGSREDQLKAWASYCEALAANVEEAKWKLSQKSLAAPKAGRVFDTFYREGEYVATGKPVLALLPSENVKIRFFAPEADAAKLKCGAKILYSSSASAEPASARISYISPEAEYTPPVIFSRESRAKLVFMVEAEPEAAAAPKLNVGTPLDVRLAPEASK